MKIHRDIEVYGLSSHSKHVKLGDLFIAGNQEYIAEARKNGAAAVLSAQGTEVEHPRPRELEAILASRLYKNPSDLLYTVGITGTNGKSTTTFMVQHLLQQMGLSSGLIGTIQYQIGDQIYPPTHTTPDICRNQHLMRQMVDQGMDACVMEVTSHALSQGRVDGISFDAAIFTQLTQDHLDYHGTMEAYAQAKNLLFRKEIKKAIVNSNCPWHQKIIEGTKGEIITYGENGDVRATKVSLTSFHTTFNVHYKGESLFVRSPYVGCFNVENYLAACALGVSNGWHLKDVTDALRDAPPVPGRLEPIDNSRGISLFVDFAHTEDALENVLSTLHSLKNGRLITVFGCGGDRDPGKRPKMAKVCEKFSDYCIITSDNPRTEDPQSIIEQILLGFTPSGQYKAIVDRREAISYAVSIAKRGDVVLIAGRGHEPDQMIANKKIPFDDRVEARKACE
ncbi:MAG: UDP-N-acetylmuramoyl-L-alanyl-D-glutamate--2,6-diaminopimelate ligase [Waddliaceae bacterium]